MSNIVTLREIKDEEIILFFHKLKVSIDYEFRTFVIVEAREIYDNEIGLVYSDHKHNGVFYLEIKNTEMLGRLIIHLNKCSGKTIDETLDTEFE